ncbi:TetR family transcriptional regulator [Streptomyces albus]|uniref:TetR family transcriptional regulator n=1 Tax=Streptomyces albus (strain ATCC 21838 / DSM 41398 / FERM P-419 / JCM 4703 / NBRC 107858) TaxID=1081613 RepID=A0A0B5EZ22_STRA4|nr:TetR family transcriptional regulator [Streptomyces albus]AOU78943.1 TetR family transcriptional regulator [Streptomyces albus]
MPERQRSDARRNYRRILAVAEEEVAARGAGASLEQIARTAGVGSATVRRHFPTRRALLEAVSRTRIEALCARARDLTGRDDSRAALLEWLDEVLAYSVSARGLASALAYDGPVRENSCAAVLEEAGDPLLRRAVRDGAVAAGVTVADLITLIVGIVLATEEHPDPAVRADRLFRLAVAGLESAELGEGEGVGEGPGRQAAGQEQEQEQEREREQEQEREREQEQEQGLS